MAIGLVLTGGFSRRLGQDKAFLPWTHSRTLLEHQVAQLRDYTQDITLLGGSGAIEEYAAHQGLGFFRDEPRGAGPAKALAQWFSQQRGEGEVLFLAVDLPFAGTLFSQGLLGVAQDSKKRYCLVGRVYYGQETSSKVKDFFRGPAHSFQDLCSFLSWPAQPQEEAFLANINTMADYQYLWEQAFRGCKG